MSIHGDYSAEAYYECKQKCLDFLLELGEVNEKQLQRLTDNEINQLLITADHLCDTSLECDYCYDLSIMGLK